MPARDAVAYEQRLAVLSIGLAGCHGDTIDGSSITYYDRRLHAYFGELIEGGFVIVKTAVLDAKPALAVLAPLCRGSLPLGERNAFHMPEDSIVVQAIASSGPENPASGLAAMMLAVPDCGAFDDVAPDVYAAWWREHGARIGRRQDNTIVWEDGAREPIRPFAQRYHEQP